MIAAHLNGATLVFDLDGTLVDTAPDLVRSLNHVLAHARCPPRRAEEVRPCIGFGARRMIAEGLLAAGSAHDAAVVDGLLPLFLEHYEANVAIESRPYPGVAGVLERAAAAGARLAVCTNKYEHLSRRLLAALDLAHYFHAVVGRDTLPVWKPDPGHLTGAIEMAGGLTTRAVMIGDSETDIATARAAGIPVVAVSFGYSELPVSSYGPDRIIGHYDELAGAIAGLIEA